jgi:hypothetical protein
MVRIAKVTPKERYQLEVQLDNGTTVILNLAARLGTLRFTMLADQSFFDSVTTDGQFVRWRDQLEISVNEVFEMAKRENPEL